MARRRRGPALWFALVAFVVMPLVEIFVLVQVGQVIGPWWTILILLADSLAGAWLVRREGGRAWQALRTALGSGRMPSDELADGALILVGGTLMLAPGFVTDLLGFVLILPVTRPLARRLLSGLVARRLLAGSTGVSFRSGPARPGGTRGPGDAGRPGPDPEGPVVRGDVVD